MPRGQSPFAYFTTRSTCACSSTLLKNGKADAKMKTRIPARAQRPRTIQRVFSRKNSRTTAENAADRSQTSMPMSILHLFFTLRIGGRMTADHEPNQDLGRCRVGFNPGGDCCGETGEENHRIERGEAPSNFPRKEKIVRRWGL